MIQQKVSKKIMNSTTLEEKEKFLKEFDDKKRRMDESGFRVFVIPNVNGNYNQMINLLYAIELIGPRASNDKIVFLGDYVDYGSQSRQVIDFLRCYQRRYDPNVILLKGDRDDAFAKCLKRYFVSKKFVNTFSSYREKDKGLDVAQLTLDRQFLNKLPTHTIIGNMFFSHSGIDFQKPLNKQEDYNYLFNRNLTQKPDIMSKYTEDKKVICTLNAEPNVNSIKFKDKVFAFSSGTGLQQQLLSSVFDAKGNLVEIIKI